MKYIRIAQAKGLLFLIVLLGFFLRVYRVTKVPPGFFCDEAAIGYNAYSLLKTGADEYGIPYPFFFRSFGDYRNPLPIYFNVPMIAAFGLNEFSVRFASAIAGTLTILTVFLLTERLFGNLTALMTSFLIAISPWHLHFSRFGSEYIYFPFLFSLGVYLFILGIEKKSVLPFGFFILGASLYTYYPAWLVTPLFTLGLVFIYRQKLLRIKKYFIAGGLIFIIILLPLLIGIKNKIALTRWNRVSVFKNLSNRPTNFLIKNFTRTYFAHFSYTFLFKEGDIGYPGHFINRFSVRGMGELYLFQLPLVILGLLILAKSLKKAANQTIILWLALYPLGSTLIGTDGGGPFAFRSIIGVVPFQIISGIGFIKILFLTKKFMKQYYQSIKIIFVILFLFVSLFSLKSYLYRYYFDYPLYSSDFWGWQYGPKEVMKYFLSVKNQYDELLLMGNFNSPEIFIKFYDPENLCQNRCQIGGLERLDFNKRQLFAVGVDRLSEIPKYLELGVIKKVDYPNQTPAFYIGEIKRFQRVSIP
jgi:4-amino-4-deoxy-L-arabinose transferase-like glycosyltransferase